MKRFIALAPLLLVACGGDPTPDNAATQTNAATPAAPDAKAFKPVFEEGQKIPVPGKIPGIDTSVPPDVARHVSRQEICGYWRSREAAGESSAQVTRNARESCDGIDAELERLRMQHADEGPAMNAMRGFVPIGR